MGLFLTVPDLFRPLCGHVFVPVRSGPRIVDSVLSEISTGFQAAVFTATCSKYTASGVRRSSAV